MNSTKNILFLIAIFLGLSLHSYSQSSDPKPQTDKFGGIGVSVDIDSSVMLPYIVDILSAKPGAMAGLRSGDHIISINGWKTKGKSQEQVAGKLRGRVGSKVDMVIDRGGKDVNFEMKREHIEVNEKAGNFCEELDTLLKSAVDSFVNIRAEKVSDIYFTEYSGRLFKSKLELPGFDSSELRIFGSGNDYTFSETYFSGKDLVESSKKFNDLINAIKDCLPYTVCSSYSERVDTLDDHIIWVTFELNKVKNPNYAAIQRAIIDLRMNCDGTNCTVWLNYFLPPFGCK